MKRRNFLKTASATLIAVALFGVGCGEQQEVQPQVLAEAPVITTPPAAETEKKEEEQPALEENAIEEEVDIIHPVVRAAVLKSLKKPSGKFAPPVKFTNTELMGVTELYFLEGLIDDAGLEEVAKFRNLKVLAMNDTKITDEGLKSVAQLQQLHTLAMCRTKITDACLADIAKLKNLRKLLLYGAKISDEGAEELRKALPECEIFGPRA